MAKVVIVLKILFGFLLAAEIYVTSFFMDFFYAQFVFSCCSCFKGKHRIPSTKAELKCTSYLDRYWEKKQSRLAHFCSESTFYFPRITAWLRQQKQARIAMVSTLLLLLGVLSDNPASLSEKLQIVLMKKRRSVLTLILIDVDLLIRNNDQL